ncbi:hypothetical protein BST46_28210, partial [Mycobacterium timonense]
FLGQIPLQRPGHDDPQHPHHEEVAGAAGLIARRRPDPEPASRPALAAARASPSVFTGVAAECVVPTIGQLVVANRPGGAAVAAVAEIPAGTSAIGHQESTQQCHRDTLLRETVP